MDVSLASQWTAFVVAVIGVLAGLARIWTKVKNSNIGDSTATVINNELLVNLKNEITRLEGIISKLNSRIGVLEQNINSLRNMEIHGATDFGALEMIITHLPCPTCVNQGEAFVQLTDVINRMRARRLERQMIIEGAVIDEKPKTATD